MYTMHNIIPLEIITSKRFECLIQRLPLSQSEDQVYPWSIIDTNCNKTSPTVSTRRKSKRNKRRKFENTKSKLESHRNCFKKSKQSTNNTQKVSKNK